MWELVATAVAGLNAGAGLQAALGGAPSLGTDSVAFASFAGRSRTLSLLLSTLSITSCLVSYYGGGWGCWCGAACGVVGKALDANLVTAAMRAPHAARCTACRVAGRVVAGGCGGRGHWNPLQPAADEPSPGRGGWRRAAGCLWGAPCVSACRAGVTCNHSHSCAHQQPCHPPPL